MKPGRMRLDYQLGVGARRCDSEVIFRKVFASELGEPDPFVVTGPVDLVVAVHVEADSPGYRSIVEVRDAAGGVLAHWEGVERTCADAGDRAMLHLLANVFPWAPQPDPPPKTEEPAPPPVVTKEEFDTLRKALEARLGAQDEAIDELRERNRALQSALNETRKRVDITYAISAGALMTANLTSNVGPGAWIGAEGRFGPVSMGLELGGVFPSPVNVVTVGTPYGFDLSLLTATLVPCGRYSYFFGCVAVGAGMEIHYDGDFDGTGGPFTHTLAIFQIGGRLGAEIPFGDSPLAGRIFGEVLYTAPTPTEVYDLDAGVFDWRRPNVSAFFGAGLVFKFGNEGAK
ncbi:MAG: hypothetical protein U0441_20570 [Polyangiaceae bacterium]